LDMRKSSPDLGKRATPADQAKGYCALMSGKLFEKGGGGDGHCAS
jgi:hypothetical protein